MKNAFLILLLSTFASITAFAEIDESLPDEQYYGYKIVHHMTSVVDHIEKFGFNSFDHPRIADYRSFVITPALDHFYSKAVADVRFGPVIIDTPARDDRYSSLEIFDVEHHAIFDQVTPKEGQRFILVHTDYKGKLPKGKVIRLPRVPVTPLLRRRFCSEILGDLVELVEIRVV